MPPEQKKTETVTRRMPLPPTVKNSLTVTPPKPVPIEKNPIPTTTNAPPKRWAIIGKLGKSQTKAAAALQTNNTLRPHRRLNGCSNTARCETLRNTKTEPPQRTTHRQPQSAQKKNLGPVLIPAQGGSNASNNDGESHHLTKNLPSTLQSLQNCNGGSALTKFAPRTFIPPRRGPELARTMMKGTAAAPAHHWLHARGSATKTENSHQARTGQIGDLTANPVTISFKTRLRSQ